MTLILRQYVVEYVVEHICRGHEVPQLYLPLRNLHDRQQILYPVAKNVQKFR